MPFLFDVFLSYSSKDKAVVRKVAERLKKDGLRVWFDEWEIKPGASISQKIEEGLEQSRVLVLCMSANAFGSDWAQLEAGTFRFRDPMNRELRFIPLRLDDAEIKGSLAQFLYVDWRGKDGYRKLLGACKPVGEVFDHSQESSAGQPSLSSKVVEPRWKRLSTALAFNKKTNQILTAGRGGGIFLVEVQTGETVRALEGHSDTVNSVAFSPDGLRALSGSKDNTLRLWNLDYGHPVCVLKGHFAEVYSVAFSPDGRRALSGSKDNTVRLWNLSTGRAVCVLKGHSYSVLSVAFSPDGLRALSCSFDNTVRLWDLKTGRTLRVLQGHTSTVLSVAFSPDGLRALSGSLDNTARLWDLKTGRALRVLEGHADTVYSVAFSPDGLRALSGSSDNTVRLWNLSTGREMRVLEGHSDGVRSVTFSPDGHCALSGSLDNTVRIWNLSDTDVASGRPADQVQYTNAKVLLVGDSGVGKTGLSNYLARNIKVEEDKPLASTDGAWATHWPLDHAKKKDGVEREIWLWDFAGQVDYRLVHQLFMDEAAAAVLVFNPQQENAFQSIGHWDRDLQKAARQPVKLLAAGRVDRGGLIASSAKMKKFMKERGFAGSLHLTSAKTGEGCDGLREAISKAVDWDGLAVTSSPALYRRMKQEILALRDSWIVLLRLSELKQRMQMVLPGENIKPEELETVIGLLAGPGMIQRLDFGGFILLRPEVLSRYSAAVVRKVRKHPQEMGCIREDELLAGKLDYQDFERLPKEDEAVVLRALLDTLVSKAWCLRQSIDGTVMLTFPSYFRRERDEQLTHPNVLVTYKFAGPTDEIYATLVVLLHHTKAFDSTELWKSAADFKTQTGAALGFTLKAEGEGTSLLEVYFAPDVDKNSRVLFLRYVHDHLKQHAKDVVRMRSYACEYCKEQFTEQNRISKALAQRKKEVFCSECGGAIPLIDIIEEKLKSADIEQQVRAAIEEGKWEVDNESRELMAVHHTGFIVAEAGQIFRPTANSDHGIDGEIEFKDDLGRASGRRLYVQLKSGDSYLKTRKRDEAEVFRIKNPRWAEYWQQQAYPVMLVVRNADGVIRWMDVSDYLKQESAKGKTVKQFVFTGEAMDVMSVRRWRDKAVEGTA